MQIDAVQDPKATSLNLTEWELLNRAGTFAERESDTDTIVSAQGELSVDTNAGMAFDHNYYSRWSDRLRASPTGPSSWIQVAFVQIARLTNVGQFLNLPNTKAVRSCPIRWEGLVLYADPQKGEVLFQDATGVTKVPVDLKSYPVAAGQWVVLEGTTSAVIVHYPDQPFGQAIPHFLRGSHQHRQPLPGARPRLSSPPANRRIYVLGRERRRGEPAAEHG